MLQVHSTQKLDYVERALPRAGQAHRAAVRTLSTLRQLLPAGGTKVDREATIFTFSQPELHAALIAAEWHFVAFLPCHVVVYEEEGGVTLEAASPREFCRLLNRPDLEHTAGLLENSLRQTLEEAARPPVDAAAAVPRPGSRYFLGATEDQMNIRATIPQRIDSHGTKIEDLAGTGRHDAPGG